MSSENNTSIKVCLLHCRYKWQGRGSLESGSAGHQLNLLSSMFLILFWLRLSLYAIILHIKWQWVKFRKKSTPPERRHGFLTPLPSTWISKTAWAPPPLKIPKFKDPPIHPDFHKIIRHHNFIIPNVEELF